jgi:hypothetical protein
MRHNLTEELVRRRLANYLAGKTTLRAFRRWFYPATWDIDGWAPASLKELVYEVKLLLAEYSNGDWTEDEFPTKMSVIIGSYEANVGVKKQPCTSIIPLKVWDRRGELPPSWAEIRSSAVCV